MNQKTAQKKEIKCKHPGWVKMVEEAINNLQLNPDQTLKNSKQISQYIKSNYPITEYKISSGCIFDKALNDNLKKFKYCKDTQTYILQNSIIYNSIRSTGGIYAIEEDKLGSPGESIKTACKCFKPEILIPDAIIAMMTGYVGYKDAVLRVHIKRDNRKKNRGFRTFVRNVKEETSIPLSKSRKINGVIREMYKYKSIPSPNIKIIPTNHTAQCEFEGSRKKRIHIHNRTGENTQCDIMLNQDTMCNLAQYFIFDRWCKNISISISEDIKHYVFAFADLIHAVYPPIFIPTMKERLNEVDLSKHYNGCQSIVFLVIHYKEYEDFYDKYKSQSNFFFVTHNEYSITMIRQCIKFMITSNLFSKWMQMNIAFYYECDDDVKQFSHAQQDQDDNLELEKISFNKCLQLLFTRIQEKGDDAIIVSVSPLRRFRFIKYGDYKHSKIFASSTKCEQFKIVRVCDEFRDVNYASEEMLKMSKSDWLELKEKKKQKILDAKDQQKYFQGEDFGLCEQLAISTKVLSYKNKRYEAGFRTKCFILEQVGITSEYNVKSACQTIKT